MLPPCPYEEALGEGSLVGVRTGFCIGALMSAFLPGEGSAGTSTPLLSRSLPPLHWFCSSFDGVLLVLLVDGGYFGFVVLYKSLGIWTDAVSAGRTASIWLLVTGLNIVESLPWPVDAPVPALLLVEFRDTCSGAGCNDGILNSSLKVSRVSNLLTKDLSF